MELGSLVCTPSEPNCPACPVSTMCAANAAGLQTEIPPAKPRPVYAELHEAAVIVRKNARRACCASARRRSDGLVFGTSRDSQSMLAVICTYKMSLQQRSNYKLELPAELAR